MSVAGSASKPGSQRPSRLLNRYDFARNSPIAAASSGRLLEPQWKLEVEAVAAR